MRRDGLLILDFLSPESLSIARKVRGERVYCTVLPCTAPLSAILKQKPLGIILAGGAEDAYEPGAADCDPAIYDLGVPLLGVGSGARLLAKHLGARRLRADVEPHSAHVSLEPSPLFSGLGGLERYFPRLDELDLPETLVPIARDDSGRVVAFADGAGGRYGMQFTAEQNDPDGLAILRNFACGICGCEQWWSMGAFIEKAVDDIREAVGEGSALMTVSGGVDSAVCAALMHRAIGARMHCVHIDTGLMRKGETRLVAQWFREAMGIELQYVDAAERFLARLAGVVEPEEKRRVIG
ncbi:MAG: 7-cyano-7-deazaguanine synthase, partial [Clostridia bacterium]|nr:7-cyano-7-deazaguanine synthase [Clostridia bacterium]